MHKTLVPVRSAGVVRIAGSYGASAQLQRGVWFWAFRHGMYDMVWCEKDAFLDDQNES
jgi:hypothetical protein